MHWKGERLEESVDDEDGSFKSYKGISCLKDSGIFMAHNLLQLSLCSDRCRALFSTVITK